MKSLPIVAIIGQTNAGKSSLFNRLARSKTAIVAREEGTTRDNVISKIDNKYILIDTAGLKDPADTFEASIQDQIEDAIASADLILLTLDSTKYLSHDDKRIARLALKSRKPTLLVLNKSDLKESLPEQEFVSLGIKNPLKVSATTGYGIDDLRTALGEFLEGSFSDRRVSPVKKSDLPGEKNLSERSELFFEPDAKKTFLQFKSTSKKRACSLFRDDAELSLEVGHTRANTWDEKLSSENSSDQPLKIALIGRPNVGKSSLFNTLGKKQQAIVSSQQGTTRDINRIEIKYKGRELEILDTAGLRKPGKREVGIEKFSALRTLAAIEEADICCLLIDSTEPHSKLDQTLAGQIIDAGKGIIFVVTKTDLLDQKTPIESPSLSSCASSFRCAVAGPNAPRTPTGTDAILNNLQNDFNFAPYAPVILTSSETGKNTTKIFELALDIDKARHTELKTSDLNKVLMDAVASHPPAGLKNTLPKLRYIVQTDTCPPWFVVHGSNLSLLHWSYKRFLDRKIRELYPFIGTPIKFSFKNRD